MARYLKLATIVFSMGLALTARAAEPTSIFPRGCEVSGFGFSKNFLILNEHGDQMFFLLQNHANQTIEIEHYETDKDVFMSPKLESQLAPMHWAAFASDVPSAYFQCFVKTGETRQPIDCSNALDVCQYPRVKFALSNMGNYWVSTDKPLGQVIKDATAKGIFLHW